MNSEIKKHIRLIGAAYDKGASKLGVALGPDAIRYAGVTERLEKLGYTVNDIGNIREDANLPPDNHGTILKNLNTAVNINRKIYEEVSSALKADEFPITIGGDHSVAIGTIKGMLSQYKNTGLIWFDAHGDINTPETSPTGNIHGMPMAVLLGKGHKDLCSIGGEDLKLDPKKIVCVASRDLDAGERKIFKEIGVTVFTMHDVDRYGIVEIGERALKIASEGTDGVYLSFDVDGADPSVIPGTGTKVYGGLNYREVCLFLEILAESDKLKGADFVEVNPILDHENISGKLTAIFIGSLMGEWLL